MSLVILGQILGIILLAIAGAKIGQVLAQKPRAIWLGGFILLMLPLQQQKLTLLKKLTH